MWKNKSCRDVSIYMLLLQVIGYFSGVMFLIIEGIESLLLSFNYYSGLFIAIITTMGWFLCDRYDRQKEINKNIIRIKNIFNNIVDIVKILIT